MHRRVFLTCALAAIGVIVAVLVAPASDAHAIPISSSPPQSARLSVPPSRVVLTMNDAIVPTSSSIKVQDCQRNSAVSGTLYLAGGNPTMPAQNVSIRANGTYSVVWQMKDASDGHVTSGLFAFQVGRGNTCTVAAHGASVAPDPKVEIPLTADFLGFAVLFGALLYLPLTHQAASGGVHGDRRILWLAIAAAFVGGGGTVFAIQNDMSGASLSAYLATRPGQILAAREALFVLAGLLALLALRLRPVAFGALAAAGLVGLTFTFLSHAFQSGVLWVMVNDYVHILSGSAWIGGLAGLFLTLPRADAPDRLITRFSAFATVNIALVVGTGILSGLAHIATAGELVASLYGQTVLVKAAVVAVMLLLGALNKWFFVPRASLASARATVHKLAAVELAAGFIVLGITGALAATGPPTLPVVAQIFDQTERTVGFCPAGPPCGTMSVRMHVDPYVLGINTANVTILNITTHAPVTTTKLVLLYVNGQVNGKSEEDTVPMSEVGPGLFTTENLTFPQAGPWSVTVDIQRTDQYDDAAAFALHIS
ncbi:MAG: copper resistance CopC/CopD family protein [Thermoplasmatota archaeon]